MADTESPDTDTSNAAGESDERSNLDDAMVEIVTQPCSLSSDEAAQRASGRLSRKVRTLGGSADVVRAKLRYKPYLEFEATLRKKIFRDEDDVYHGAIVVDGFTGVARPILKAHVETSVERVPAADVLNVEVDETTARNRANRNRIEVQQRESGKIELSDEPTLVYKPLWLVEFENGDIEVVDATNGQVFGDGLL